ncbi:hypothetical protein CPB86DRAFT_785943 [Serendipita vermifera]|nr:hypothetical protein CPB86DRAFT_785943 [Serendipita vermifera]
MPRHNRETSPLNRTTETIRTSNTRADSAARSLSIGRSSTHRRTASQSEVAPKLGGRAALLLFIAILIAFVVQSSATQHVQTNLGFRHPYLIFYIAHSCFSLIFPLHLALLKVVSDKPTSYYISLMLHTFRINFPITTDPNTTRSAFLTQKIVTTILLTIAIALPGLLWYIAVSLGPSISDVTAIWNTSALWAYILSVAMLSVDSGTDAPSAWWKRLELRKLVVIAMACTGVAVVVYSGSDSSSDKKETSEEKDKSELSAPLVGDLLTVLASVLYALVQVLYKKYIALPNEPSEAAVYTEYTALGRGETQDGESSPLVTYQAPLSPIADRAEDEDSEGRQREQQRQPTDSEEPRGVPSDPSSPPPFEETLPFGLYPNFVTSLVGFATLLLFWPLALLDWLSSSSTSSIAVSAVADTSFLDKYEIILSIALIASAGLVWNGGYLVLLALWGPVLSSVGNLLTIVLMLLVEILILSAPVPSGWSILGCCMIASGFGLLVWEIMRPNQPERQHIHV